MAPKRHKGEGSSSAPPHEYDHARFVSAEAAERFETFIASKALTPERGLHPDALADGEMGQQISEREWDTLTDHPDPAVVSIVQEFYSNAKDLMPYAVIVRGSGVSFSAQAINDYYDLETPEVCQYSEFLRSGPDYEKIVSDLCKPGTTWVKKGTRGAMCFSSKDLSLYGKIWFAFICAKLMPTQHVSEVTKERAVLLYAIVKGFSINVGDIIEHNIRRFLRTHIQGGLPHPSLICGLCRAAGVRWAGDEIVQYPLQPLDHKLIERYKVWDGAESHPRGLGFILQALSEEDEDPEEPAASSSQPKARFSSQFRNLQLHTDKRIKRLERQNSRIAERQEHMFSYHTSFNAALAEQFARLNPNAPVQFPVPQPLPPFPPSDSDTEEAGAEHNA